ncbi:MAG: hypothetical protein GY804_13455 [Alphaproteobacteria bacterium]|nr:hypothetical protein [Alphaproteobacteria bacterium]
MKKFDKNGIEANKVLNQLVLVLLVALFCFSFASPSYAGFLENLKNDFLDCWTCEIAAGLLNVMGHVAYKASEQIFDAAWKILGAGLALWLAFTTIRHMNPITPMSPGSYIGEISGRLFAALFIAAFFGAFSLTAHPSEMFNIVVRPIFQLSQTLCLDFIYSDLGSIPNRIDNTIVNRVVGGGTGVNGIKTFNYLPENIFELDDIKNSIKIFASVVIRLSESMVNALTVMSQSMVDSEGNTPVVRSFLVGVIIVIPYLWMLFTAHMTLADMFIRIAIVGALLPLLMTAWVFPYTRAKYAKVGFEIVMNATIVIMLLGIFIGILSAVIEINVNAGPLDMGLPRLINADLTVSGNPPDAVGAEAAIANINSDKLYLSIFLPWLMMATINMIYAWGDKFAANIAGAQMAMSAGSYLAGKVMPSKTVKNMTVQSSGRLEQQDPLSNQRDPEGDGRHGDVGERRYGV